MKLKVSLGQMDVQLGQPEKNLATVESMVTEAAEKGSDLILFPALWSSGYDLKNANLHATALDQGVFAETANLARKYGLSILGSCLSLKQEGQFGNTAVYFDDKGQQLGAYTKIHLFRLMVEDQYLSPGEYLTAINTAWGRVGLAICYDLRFPEIFRAYALAGAKIVLLPAQWPYPRLSHWQTLLRARAIENQLVIIACNRVGATGDTTYCGHSTIIDPWGDIIVEGSDSPDLLSGTVDLDRVDEVRTKIPILSDRRPDAYTVRICGL
jgi:omega-amidase